MSKQDNLKDFLTDLANTIRTKKRYPDTQKINPQNFSGEVLGIVDGRPTLFPPVITGGYNQISWVTDPRNGSFNVVTSATLDGVDITGDTLYIQAEDADKHLVVTSRCDNFEPASVDILIYHMSAQSSLISISDGKATSDYGLCVEVSDTDILVPQGYETNVGSKYFSYKTTTDADGDASESLTFSVAALSDQRPSTFKLSVVDEDDDIISGSVSWTITKNGTTVYTGTSDSAELSIPAEVTWEQGDDLEFIVNAMVVLKQMPVKGDIVYIDMDGDRNNEKYRVISVVNDTTVELVAMANATIYQWGSRVTQTYSGSYIDSYLNSTLYAGLSSEAKQAIVDKTFSQDSFRADNEGNPVYHGFYGQTSPGTKAYDISLVNPTFEPSITRHIYALSVQDVVNYVMDTTITDGLLQNYNIWKAFWDTTSQPQGSEPGFWLRSAETKWRGYVEGVVRANGNIAAWQPDQSGIAVRPAFQIDLTKIEWSK